jgi:hypothetical protein
MIPAEVIIDFRAKIADMSAIDALNKITERYAKLMLHLRHLYQTVVNYCIMLRKQSKLISWKTQPIK